MLLWCFILTSVFRMQLHFSAQSLMCRYSEVTASSLTPLQTYPFIILLSMSLTPHCVLSMANLFLQAQQNLLTVSFISCCDSEQYWDQTKQAMRKLSERFNKKQHLQLLIKILFCRGERFQEISYTQNFLGLYQCDHITENIRVLKTNP